MKYFAITLKCNHRVTLERDVTLLKDVMNKMLQSKGSKILPFVYEIQPAGIHNVHCHFMLEMPTNLNFKDIHNYSKQNDVHCHIKEIKSKEDGIVWLKYCNKSRCSDLAWDYAETTGSDCNKISLFPQVTAQQMGLYKEWDNNKKCVWCGEKQCMRPECNI